jgi:hypothetical protein
VEEEMKRRAIIAGTRSVATLKERQEEAPMRHSHRRVLGGVLVATLAVLLAGTMLEPARATPVKWVAVSLGTHRFGHPSAPNAIVARAGPEDVGWEMPKQGAFMGPWSFDVAGDGSIWLLDEVNNRLLVWQAGRPEQPARIVPLPKLPFWPADFALGPGGAIYLTSPAPREPDQLPHMDLYALTPAAQVRWKAPLATDILNVALRVGPDGALWTVAGSKWTPVTTKNGRPLSLAEQRRRTSRYQPLPGGLRLGTTYLPSHEMRFTLIDRADQVVRAWRVSSRTELWPGRATPALVGRDLVVPLDVTQQTQTDYLREHLVLRLAATGETRQGVALDPDVVWGDDPITGLRVGPEGKLYQLRTDRTTGVSIARYSLDPAQVAPPATTAARVVPTATPSLTQPRSAAPRVTQPTVTAPKVTVPPTQPVTPAASESASWWIMPGLAALGTSALAALGVWLLYRLRHPSGHHEGYPGAH